MVALGLSHRVGIVIRAWYDAILAGVFLIRLLRLQIFRRISLVASDLCHTWSCSRIIPEGFHGSSKPGR